VESKLIIIHTQSVVKRMKLMCEKNYTNVYNNMSAREIPLALEKKTTTEKATEN
jgi:hypothetical protein